MVYALGLGLLLSAAALTEGYATQQSQGDFLAGVSTRYGEHFNGSGMACGSYYNTNDPTIIAVGYEDDAKYKCGQAIELCSRSSEDKSSQLFRERSTYLYSAIDYNGNMFYLRCFVGRRVDTCPGCESGHFDLSEQGQRQLDCWDFCKIYYRAIEIQDTP